MNKLKEIYIKLGVFQCVVLILSYFTLFFEKNDELLVFQFVYSLFLGFFIIEHLSKKSLANNVLLVFYIFLFFYGVFNSIIQLVLNGSIDNDVYEATIIYGLTLPSFLIGISSLKIGNYDVLYLNHSNRKLSGDYVFALLSLLIILVIYKTFYLSSVGLLFNLSAISDNSRLDMFKNISQVEVVLSLLISGLFLYFIYYYKTLSRKLLICVSILFLYYVLLQLGAGNRREFVPMLLGAFWVFINKKGVKFNFIWFLLFLIGIFIFNFFGTLRSNLMNNNTESDFNSSMIETLTSNEFVYPFYTLSFEVDDYQRNTNNFELRYGESILIYPIVVFIPRSVFEAKPKSLSEQFRTKFYGDSDVIGFAYTPVSEFFINFGPVGPFIFYFFLGLVIVKITQMKNQIMHFLFFALCLDFCRGEIASFIYQLFFVSLFLIIIPNIRGLFK